MTRIDLTQDPFEGITPDYCFGPFSVAWLEKALPSFYRYVAEQEDPRKFLQTCVQSFIIDMPCTPHMLAMNNLTGYRRTMMIAEQQWGGVFQ